MAEFTFDLEDGNDFYITDSSTNYAAYPLCVPQDRIEDIELYPNFVDDSISLADLENYNPSSTQEFETPQMQKARVMLRKRVAVQDCNIFAANKKQRGKREGRRVAWSISGVSFAAENVEPVRRMCSHCQTTETPQWRIGPLGPKTLCNACGVRYKSGRLLPEYRPAASPTFDSHKHSNFHRKILKKKGVIG